MKLPRLFRIEEADRLQKDGTGLWIGVHNEHGFVFLFRNWAENGNDLYFLRDKDWEFYRDDRAAWNPPLYTFYAAWLGEMEESSREASAQELKSAIWKFEASFDSFRDEACALTGKKIVDGGTRRDLELEPNKGWDGLDLSQSEFEEQYNGFEAEGKIGRNTNEDETSSGISCEDHRYWADMTEEAGRRNRLQTEAAKAYSWRADLAKRLSQESEMGGFEEHMGDEIRAIRTQDGHPVSPMLNGSQNASKPYFQNRREEEADGDGFDGFRAHLLSVQRRDENEIRKLIEDREITSLLHFTRLDNLLQIVKAGIVPRAFLTDNFVSNDSARLDGEPEASCLSVSYPNYRMLFKHRSHNAVGSWALIFLDTAILMAKPCLFFPENAASHKQSDEKKRSIEEFMGHRGLCNMFRESQNGRARKDLGLPDKFTTHPEAEVLVYGVIEPKLILGIHLMEHMKPWANRHRDEMAGVTVRFNDLFFKPRLDYKHWKCSDADHDGS